MKSAVFLLLLLLLFQQAYAQKHGQEEIDSLLSALPQIKTDTFKIKAWISLADNYSVINPDSGLIYADLALEKSRNIDWHKGEVHALNLIGTSYFRKGAYDKALNFLFESVSRSSELHDSDALASSYDAISMIYVDMGNDAKALKYAQDELTILEIRKNKNALPAAYNSMGIIYSNLKNNQESLRYYEKSLVAAKEVNDQRMISYAYSNSGIIYTELKQFSKALDYHFKALKIEEEMDDVYGMGTEFGSISNAYIGTYNEQKQKTSPASRALIDSAIFYAYKGMEYCKKCGDLIDEMSITFSLSDAYKLKGDHRKALELYTEASNLKDSIFSAEKQTKIREVESEQQARLNEKEMQLLHASHKLERYYYLAGGGFLLLLSIGIFSRLQVIRKTKRKLEEKNKIITAEKKRSDDLLLNILPEEVAEELKAKGSADAKHFNEVTVMFTDFKDFTQLSEKLSPTELVLEIHSCFTAFDNIIGKHNIEKIKTIGDSYMCAGGLPVSNTTNAKDVVRAALEIQQFMQEHLAQRKAAGKEQMEIRIGIHTGPVVAGIVGVKKFAYDIWGDTVNIASRMESSGEAGKVNISGSTYELVKDQFNCTHRGKIQAKNKGEISMYFVESGS